MPEQRTSRAERILGSIGDMVLDFLYYDRKEDETLPVGEIEAAVRCGEITVNEIIETFSAELRERIEG